MKNCRLCHSKKVKLVVKLAPMPIGDAYLKRAQLRKQQVFAVDLFLCRDCGLAQLPAVVPPENIYRPYIYRSADSSGLVRHFQEYAQHICAKFKPPRGRLAIDIGSNDGSFVRCFKSHGLKILGIDPAVKIAREAAKAGVPTIAEFFNQTTAGLVRKEHGQAWLVTANNIFANVDDLDDFIAGVKELLLPDGLFVFETGYVLDLLQKTIFDNIYHEHLSYFSVKPLAQFFRRHNLQLIDAERVATKGGSLRGFVRHARGARAPASRVRALIALEEDCGVQQEEIFRFFSAQLNLIKEHLTTLVKRLRARGQTIAGYGASVGVTTIIYNCGLRPDALDYLVDDNPQRQGLYSPGYHLRVLHPKAIYEKKPDYVLLLAWQYAAPIMAKHRRYLAEGGRFILILPQVRIVEQNEAL